MDHFTDFFFLSANQKYNDLQIITEIVAVILIFSNYSHYLFFIFQKLWFISHVKWFTE